MVLVHNMSALGADRQFGVNSKKVGKLTEKLSSGYRINRSADDAAGLAISEKMRRQIRGLTQASLNAQDGISMVQIADGALEGVQSMLQRGNELAVKAANGTLTDDDRALIDEEIQQLKSGIDEIAHNTVFNDIELFPEDGDIPSAASGNTTYHYEIKYNLTDGTFSIGNEEKAATQSVGGARAASGSTTLADKIANELVPNAVKQIFDAFPALRTAMGSDTVEMSLDISYIDGKSGTLAYAQYSYYPTGKPINMLLKVDSADFDDADAAGTGSAAEALESTIAHEITHSVMQYLLTDGMSGRNGSEKYPEWFVEGAAQLSGGGFPTNWNSELEYYVSSLTGANDSSKDANIESYLKKYTVAGRPYGHGYLAMAYLGYKASGASDVTGANIAAGMNKIFSSLLNGKSLNEALTTNAGIALNGVEGLFQNASAGDDLVTFVRKLSYASKGGAGSVIASTLGTGGTDILGNTANTQAFWIKSVKTATPGAARIGLHVGAESGVSISLDRYRMDAAALGLTNTDVKTTDNAGDAIDSFKEAIEKVSSVRSYYGAIQNRLEHTINNLDNIVENTTAAESAIRDTDIAETMVAYSNQNILLQAGQAVLTQANRQPEMVLSLLG